MRTNLVGPDSTPNLGAMSRSGPRRAMLRLAGRLLKQSLVLQRQFCPARGLCGIPAVPLVLGWAMSSTPQAVLGSVGAPVAVPGHVVLGERLNAAAVTERGLLVDLPDG